MFLGLWVSCGSTDLGQTWLYSSALGQLCFVLQVYVGWTPLLHVFHPSLTSCLSRRVSSSRWQRYKNVETQDFLKPRFTSGTLSFLPHSIVCQFPFPILRPQPCSSHFSRISFKCNRRYIVFYVWLLTLKHNDFEIHPCSYTYQSFIPFYWWIVFVVVIFG